MIDTYEVKVTYSRPKEVKEIYEIVVSEKELQVSIDLRLKNLGEDWKVEKVDRP